MIYYKYVVKGDNEDEPDLCYYFPTIEELQEFSSFNYYKKHIVYIQIEKITLVKLVKLSLGWGRVKFEKQGKIL